MQAITNLQLTYVQASPKIIQTCSDFANNLMAKPERKSWYEQNRNWNPRYTFIQLRDGKLCEYFVNSFINYKWGLPKANIDIAIDTVEERKNKGYDADLAYSGYKVAVKSWTLGNKYEESYTFDITDPVINKNQPSNYFLACVVVDSQDDQQIKLALRSLIKMQDIKAILKEPIKESLKKIKRCVYAADLINLSRYMGWL